MRHFKKRQKHSIKYNDSLSTQYLSHYFSSILKSTDAYIAVLCIGTDRSTGDCYGPLTGTILSEYKLHQFNIYGTLTSPVHALNLEETLQSIYHANPNALVIAIDAALGQSSSIGQLVYGVGEIEPGKAVQKKLPSVGDMFITGIVNVAGFMEFTTLQNTRLSLVYKMAQKTARSLLLTDYYVSNQMMNPVINE